MRWLAWLAAGLLLVSCSAARGDRFAQMTVIPGVPPFAEQRRSDDCGAVALASLLAHAGRPFDQAQIDQAVYDPRLRGSLLPDLENFAARLGLATRSGRGDLALLRDLLERRRPVLLLLDLGWGVWRRPHYAVAFGYDEERFAVHVRSGESLVLDAPDLERLWAKAGHLYLFFDSP